VKLFERTTRRVSLTMVGRAFLPQVERILDDLDIALMGISNVASTRMGDVTIACVPSTAYYFMPHVISAFHKLYPKIRLRVLDASAGEVCNAVESGEADFGVSFSGSLADEVEFELLFQERYVLACRRDHPLAERASVSWAEAYEHDYITVDKTSGNRFLTGPGPARRAGEKAEYLRDAPRDHHDRLGRGGAGCGDGAVDCHAGH